MTINISLLDIVRKDGPASTSALWHDSIVVMRLASPCKDLPASEPDLLACLRALEKCGSVRLTERGWEAVYSPPKPEPQKELFV